MKLSTLSAFIFLLVSLSACARAATPTVTPTRTPALASPSPAVPPLPSQTASPTVDPSLAVTPLPPEDWQQWPVVPTAISERALEIYRRGQQLGNSPSAFSKVGDCEATPSWFLGAFDGNPNEYSLGSYGDLQAVIAQFHGSYGRTSLAVGRGFTAANVLAPLWADHTQCETNETPLACEVRVNRPSFAFVMLGTNDVYHQETFDANMRRILNALIQDGVVPILATKADDLEGDHAINLEIARLAYEYELPLWNFWTAIQPLPDHGLQEDGSHLTWGGPFFDDPNRMRAAWPWRNLTALQVLDFTWRSVTAQP
jgi:hypothetical protein